MPMPDLGRVVGVRDLRKVQGQWQGLIGGIPSGDGRVFHAAAYDSSDTLIYEGQTENVTITKGQKVAVLILLQQKDPPDPFNNTVPYIDSLVASSNAVAPGDAVSLAIAAHDVDPGDTITYAWTSAEGAFDDPSSSSPTWTAPAVEGDHALVVTVTDLADGSRSVTLNVEVRNHHGSGVANVEVQFNTWPEIANVLANPGKVDVLEATSLEAVAFDNDGDTLSFSWSDEGGECDGTFSAASAPNSPWTAPAAPPASVTCTLHVDVNDGRGGSNTGTIRVHVGTPDSFNIAPVVDTAYQSTDQVSPGERVYFGIVAHDPEAGSLTFSWSSADGTLENQVDGAGTSEIEWLAPTVAGSYVVTVMVADDESNTVVVFNVDVIPSCGAEESWNGQICVAKSVPIAGGYSIDSTEVTRSQYEAWLGTNPSTIGQVSACSWNTAFTPDANCMGGACQGAECVTHPQVCADWCDAYAYCKGVGKRLCGRIGGGPNSWDDYADASTSQWYSACTSGGQNAFP
jgi:Sulfatase-modifying factor enzyme 1